MIKKLYALVLRCIQAVLGIDAAKKFDTRLRFHRRLDLRNPQSLAEKVCYIELHDQSPLASYCTDKLAVRDYVKSKGLESILVPVVGNGGGYSCIDEIDFSELPCSFVLKATHGCKMNYFVPDKSKMNVQDCKKEMKRWLRTTYGTYSMEPHYIPIPHRIYAEKYLCEMKNVVDYKFHCLNGKSEFVLVITDRHVDGDSPMKVTIDAFDMEWNPIYEVVGSGAEIPGSGKVAKPSLFEEMKNVAVRLSEDFKFVRVDLYQIENRVYFGELTFSPAGCVFAYLSEKFLNEMGSKLEI